MAEREGFELEAIRRRERSGSLLPKSRAQPGDLRQYGGERGIRT